MEVKYVNTTDNKASCKECHGSAICQHTRQRKYCKECYGSGICQHNRQRPTCITCSPLPLLSCTFSLCNYQTKVKESFIKHQKTHTPEYTKQRKLEKVKIQKLLINNNINHTREHTITYSCIHDTDNKNSRVDFLIEHADNNSTYGLIFLEVDEHQHDGYIYIRIQFPAAVTSPACPRLSSPL